jgi:hypothetical protein
LVPVKISPASGSIVPLITQVEVRRDFQVRPEIAPKGLSPRAPEPRKLYASPVGRRTSSPLRARRQSSRPFLYCAARRPS